MAMASFIVKCRNLALTGSRYNQTRRCISTTIFRKGFEEFFPPGVYEEKNYVEDEVVVGRRWKISELRIRSNTDLHKFWYVLLKERNMLITLDRECKRLGMFVPGPTRLNKVEKTMELVEIVVKEREQAVMNLEKEKRYRFDESEEKHLVTNIELVELAEDTHKVESSSSV